VVKIAKIIVLAVQCHISQAAQNYWCFSVVVHSSSCWHCFSVWQEK